MSSPDDFEELLLCEAQSTEAPFHSHDLSSIITEKICSDKERTREESYEEITKSLHQSKLQTIQLEKELQFLKQNTAKRCLKQFYEQIEQLNHENQQLRQELKESKRGNQYKTNDNKSERLSHRSGVKVLSTRGQENQRTSTKANKNRNNSPNLLLRRRDVSMTESTSHLGRSQVLSPSQHTRKQTMLTQRKREGRGWGCQEAQQEMRDSISRGRLQASVQPTSLIHQMLTQMLAEQRQAQSAEYGCLFEDRQSTWKPPKNCSHLTQLEGEISHCSSSLQTLSLVLNRYQKQIKSMNMSLKDVEGFIERLMKTKGKLIKMYNYTQGLSSLRQEVSEKEALFTQKNSKNQEGPAPIPSIETMLKVVSNNPNKRFQSQSKSLYSLYAFQIREAFKYQKQDQAKRYQKVQKVKQTIDSIKQTRSKFTQLITIYEQRINALQQKVQKTRLKIQRSSHK